MKTIIEIGSRAGRSTFALLAGVANNSGRVIAVDIWQVKSIYNQFLDNVGDIPGLEAYPRDSIMASKELGDADMIFIDRTPHKYPDVSADLAAWAPKARLLICGHDFANQYPGCQKAVGEYFGGSQGLIGSIWYKEKNIA